MSFYFYTYLFDRKWIIQHQFKRLKDRDLWAKFYMISRLWEEYSKIEVEIDYNTSVNLPTGSSDFVMYCNILGIEFNCFLIQKGELIFYA